MQKIFPFARLALKLALIELNFKEGDVILAPDFNCDVIYHPIRELGINLKLYPVSDTFNPNWRKVEELLCSKSKGILMVHYFAQPQHVEKFKRFCKQNNLYLIEDNSHGYSSQYQNKLLGKNGDIGFSSPRKQLNIQYGAVLYINGGEVNFRKLYYDKLISLRTIKQILLKKVSNFTLLKRFLKFVFFKKPDYSNPHSFKEVEIKFAKIDLYSIRKIHNSNWVKIGIARRKSWNEWVKLCSIYRMIPVWEIPGKTTCPWLMPVYVEDEEFRTKLLNASWEAGLGLITWPSLPDIVLKSNQYESAKKRWSKLICIPLDKSPRGIGMQIEKFNSIISKEDSK